jgi:quinolinate synthase
VADGFSTFEFTPAVEAATQPIWEKVRARITPIEWRAQAPLIAAINALKAEKNAVILAHNYMTPDIFHGVGDYVGDSLGLAREAAKSDAKIIVQAGVHFMAETSKVLCPDKTVLIPDLQAGCSLAASITAADVRLIKQRYPGVPVVTYVNTTAEVKAETDICCTSANAVQVVEHWPATWRARPISRSSPGKAVAKSMSDSTPRTSASCARLIPTRKSWPIRNARPRCWSCRISPARPRR